MIRTFHAVAIALAVTFTMPAMAQEVVNFGVQPSTQPILIAQGAGYLKPIEEKYKIKIVLRSFSYGAPENQALAAGELQIASAGMGPAMLAAARLPATLVAIDILDQTAILVPKGSKITKGEELKGRQDRLPRRGVAAISVADKGAHGRQARRSRTYNCSRPTVRKSRRCSPTRALMPASHGTRTSRVHSPMA